MSVIKNAFSGSVIGSALGIESDAEKATEAAANAQETAAQQGIEEVRRQFDATQENLQPFQQAGQAAVGEQQNLLGLNGVEAQQGSFDSFNASPGQKFLRDRAQKNLVRNSAAIGGLGGSNVRSALVEQGVGFAQQDYNNQFGRLGQLAGQGQAAATNIGQLGAQSSGQVQQGMMQSGQARASGILGVQQAKTDQFGNLLKIAGGIF
jgi:hypothetical protein